MYTASSAKQSAAFRALPSFQPSASVFHQENKLLLGGTPFGIRARSLGQEHDQTKDKDRSNPVHDCCTSKHLRILLEPSGGKLSFRKSVP